MRRIHSGVTERSVIFTDDSGEPCVHGCVCRNVNMCVEKGREVKIERGEKTKYPELDSKVPRTRRNVAVLFEVKRGTLHSSYRSKCREDHRFRYHGNESVSLFLSFPFFCFVLFSTLRSEQEGAQKTRRTFVRDRSAPVGRRKVSSMTAGTLRVLTRSKIGLYGFRQPLVRETDR